MNPEDSVLVGVINRKKDFQILREQGWYRIPVDKVAREPRAKYMAFFFSKAFGPQNGGIHYYAPFRGVEQATRADLMPDEASHKRAKSIYYKVQVGDLHAKLPPILNTKKRLITFIYSTWDRFVDATAINDLYLDDDNLVDRVFHALEDRLPTKRLWQLEGDYPAQNAQIRVLCEDGEVLASPHPGEGIQITEDVQGAVERINREVVARGGPRTTPTPLE